MAAEAASAWSFSPDATDSVDHNTGLSRAKFTKRLGRVQQQYSIACERNAKVVVEYLPTEILP